VVDPRGRLPSSVSGCTSITAELSGDRAADGEILPIPGAKERALLAVLLIHAGEVVSAGRLIEALWGEHPPADAANALQARVSYLRKALRRGAGALRTRKPGYVLEVDPEQVDAGRFARLAAQARGLLEQDPARGAALLDQALGLWRGAALAESADQDFAQAESTRLEELRRAAVEDRIDARLALGAGPELVGELEALVAGHPLRERLWGQLMRALYRSGRQADALSAYQQARRVLGEELGLDPSPPAAAAGQAILRQDPSLAAAPAWRRARGTTSQPGRAASSAATPNCRSSAGSCSAIAW
jgi:DNA-binding SARP family transcriptional activator